MRSDDALILYLKKKKKKKKVLRHGFSLQSAESEHSDANVFPAAGADSVLG